MPPSLREYKDSLFYQETSEPYVRGLEVAMGLLKTAAVSFDHLTNSPEWDRFLSYIQAQQEIARKERDSALLACGGAVGDTLTKAQFAYQYHDGYVKALDCVMSLPNQIRDAYSERKQLRPSSSP